MTTTRTRWVVRIDHLDGTTSYTTPYVYHANAVRAAKAMRKANPTASVDVVMEAS